MVWRRSRKRTVQEAAVGSPALRVSAPFFADHLTTGSVALALDHTFEVLRAGV